MARPKKETVLEQDVIDTVDKDITETPVIEKKPVETLKKKEFKDHDYILCHSVTTGGLGIIGNKTDTYYRFNQYGDECDIEYIDLVQLVRSKSEHIFMPRIIIDDEDFLAEFPSVVDAYNNMYSKGDLKQILALPADQMRVEIEKLPEGAKDTIKTMAATAIANGSLDSIASVRVLSDVFGADFNLISELFGEK